MKEVRDDVDARAPGIDARYGHIFEHANDAIFVIDAERDQILDVNDKACRMLSYSREELSTNALKHASPGDRRGEVRVELRRTSARDMLLAVDDDGVGMPGGMARRNQAPWVCGLVSTSVEQLEGHLKIVHGSRTTFRIVFPV